MGPGEQDVVVALEWADALERIIPNLAAYRNQKELF